MSSEKRTYELKARADRQQETRRRIIDATVALHEELGPARTTVSEIARRAGVQRLTVYNHFPDTAELFAACQGQFLAEHPPPDLGPALALDDPHARVRAALAALYASYRAREPMTAKVQRDRSALPALDALMARTADAQLAELAAALAAPFGARGRKAQRRTGRWRSRWTSGPGSASRARVSTMRRPPISWQNSSPAQPAHDRAAGDDATALAA
jgi:AcrR family transcriptional regulator